MKYIFDTKDCDEYLTIQDIKEGVFDSIDMKRVLYSYDLLGYLHSFNITDRGMSCKDNLGNYVYFKNRSKYKFYKCAFMYDDSIDLE